ncbi:MAG: GNAT family N-acetyltransferase [Solirubrobacteraceae bacterium]
MQISPGSVEEIPLLAHVFLSLHEHHRRVSAVAVTEPDERAWSARVTTYTQHLAHGRALLHLAQRGGRCLGYAFTILHPGSDDTFPLGAGYAELYTLAVLADERGSGIGSALLDALDAALDQRQITSLTVAVMCANAAAIRLYRRRGLVPAELIMYRIGESDVAIEPTVPLGAGPAGPAPDQTRWT